MMNGIYAAYLTGAAGMSLAMFTLLDGIVTGVDVAGMHYDGTFQSIGETEIHMDLTYKAPASTLLITGGTVGAQDQVFRYEFSVPISAFLGGGVITLDTPTGPLNAKFERLRQL